MFLGWIIQRQFWTLNDQHLHRNVKLTKPKCQMKLKCLNVKPPRPPGRGFASRAYAPGKEEKHFCIAPLDPALKDGRSALWQHFVRGEHAGQNLPDWAFGFWHLFELWTLAFGILTIQLLPQNVFLKVCKSLLFQIYCNLPVRIGLFVLGKIQLIQFPRPASYQ